jgi:Leucine-rich repeat (LRR) protein
VNENINELFGDLRSVMTAGDPDPRELYWLLESAYNEDPDVYLDQWKGYLLHYSPVELLITSLEELDMLPLLLPKEKLQAVNLSMTGHHLRKWHFEHIADSEASWFLRTLNISDNQAKHHYPAAFAHTETLINLHTLNMSNCDLHALVAEWILRAPFLASVRDLDLSENPLTTHDVEVFAANENISNIERLVLTNCGLGHAAIYALVESPHFESLRELDLTGNALTKSSFILLADWPQIAKITTLELPWKSIDLKTREYMLSSEYFSEEMKDFIFEQTLTQPNG